MADKTQKELLQELHQAVVGIPENPDENGLIGDVKDLTKAVKEQNGRVRRNSKILFTVVGILIGTGILGGLEMANVVHLIGG